jgi:hypothetical protein
MKKDFTKRSGQLFALGVQHGFTPEELMEYLNESFMFLYSKERQKEIKKHITDVNYTKDRYAATN